MSRMTSESSSVSGCLSSASARRRHVDADRVSVLPRSGKSSHQKCCGRLVKLMSTDCHPSVQHLSTISTDRDSHQPHVKFPSTGIH